MVALSQRTLNLELVLIHSSFDGKKGGLEVRLLFKWAQCIYRVYHVHVFAYWYQN